MIIILITDNNKFCVEKQKFNINEYRIYLTITEKGWKTRITENNPNLNDKINDYYMVVLLQVVIYFIVGILLVQGIVGRIIFVIGGLSAFFTYNFITKNVIEPLYARSHGPPREIFNESFNTEKNSKNLEMTTLIKGIFILKASSKIEFDIDFSSFVKEKMSLKEEIPVKNTYIVVLTKNNKLKPILLLRETLEFYQPKIKNIIKQIYQKFNSNLNYQISSNEIYLNKSIGYLRLVNEEDLRDTSYEQFVS